MPTLLKILLLLVLTSASIDVDMLTGEVVGVTDGDTITVLVDEASYKVRLDGIDCPEKKQPFGTVARKFTSEKCFGETVVVLVRGRDRYGRILGEVILPDGGSLNEELLKAGYAWWFYKYSRRKTLRDLERSARAARRGLWSDAQPQPPWDYRKERRGGVAVQGQVDR